VPYIVPTLDEFYVKFPELEAGADDDAIELRIAEAARYVDDSWREADYQDAILYLAAHWNVAAASADQSGSIKSESFGPISVTYGDRNVDDTSLGSTQYGNRFSELRRGNFPAILVV